MILESILGGVIGIVGGVLNGFTEVRKHKAETVRLEKQWTHEEVMFSKQTDAQREVNADEAFNTSLKSTGNSSLILPDGTYKWLMVPLVLTESLRRMTRPLLTWGLVVAAAYREHMTPAAMMAVGWWFGSRTTTRFMEK